MYTLYQMRKLSKKNGSAVARALNTTYQSLRNWEKGDAIPNIVIIKKLLEIYGYEFNQLDMSLYNNETDLRVKNAKEKAMEGSTH